MTGSAFAASACLSLNKEHQNGDSSSCAGNEFRFKSENSFHRKETFHRTLQGKDVDAEVCQLAKGTNEV